MAKHIETGKAGEAMALQYLEAKGMLCKAKNYRFGKAEVDLIMAFENTIVFVEVKTRRNNRYGYPEDFVNNKKQSLMIEAACEYLYYAEHEGEFRFDIVSITLEPVLEIIHFPDAFFPEPEL